MNDRLSLFICVIRTYTEGATLERNAYNEIYSRNSLNVYIIMFKDILDNWRISLMPDRFYLY